MLNERLCEMLEQYAKDVYNEAKGIDTPTFLQVYKLATDKWGYSTPEHRDTDLEGISSTIRHPTEGIKTPIQRANAAIIYSITTGQKIPGEIILDKVFKNIIQSRAFTTAYERFKELNVQNFNVFRKHFKQTERNNRECRNSVEQHGCGMGADELATNEMTKNLTDLANALRQTEIMNGVTGQTENNYALKQIKNGVVSL